MTTEREWLGHADGWIAWDGSPPAMGNGWYWVSFGDGAYRCPVEWSSGTWWTLMDDHPITHYHPTRLEPPA